MLLPDTLGVPDTDGDKLAVGQGVTLWEGVKDAVPHDVREVEEEGDRVEDTLPETLTDQLPEGVRVPLPLVLAVAKVLWDVLSEGEVLVVKVGKREPLPVIETEALGLGLTLCEPDRDAVPHSEPLGDGVVEGEPEGLCTPEGDTVSVPEVLVVCEVDGETEGDREPERLTVAVTLGECEGQLEEETEGEVDKVTLELEQ